MAPTCLHCTPNIRPPRPGSGNQWAPEQTVLYLASLDTPIHNITEVIKWIQVWGMWVNDFNVFVIQKPTNSSCMKPGIVMHQEKPRTHCNSVRNDNGSEEFTSTKVSETDSLILLKLDRLISLKLNWFGIYTHAHVYILS